ncbi:hypothetical protein [Propionimicrobium sp. PCR01-08-3]|uniref:hypothetical protein n=1 Tax=Propionimicrobium sp. PCR01-08-3 TaxID=3052086 RepID=UPI00255C33DD|nr:hypothetical protein [Propionimicrobium sp. PCR01-08-3]WIY84338.1 hypothetical protein QQ658_15110 [Propionimicrobium sp. PCR01-08-3]
MYSIKVTDGLGVVLHASANHTDLQDGVLTDAAGLDGTSSELTKEDLLGDGAAIGNMRRPGREVTLEGTLVGSEDQVKSALARIPGLFSDKQLGTLEEDRDGAVRTCQVVLDGQPKVSAVFNDEESVADWQLPLFAPDPHLYGSPRQTLLHPVGSGVGLQYPLFAPKVTTRESRRNLMVYPRTTASRAVGDASVSAGASQNGWGVAATRAIVVADGGVPSGSGYVSQIRPSGAGRAATGLHLAITDPSAFGAAEGVTYTGSIYVRTSIDISIRAALRFLKQTAPVVGNLKQEYGDPQLVRAGQWVRLSVSSNAPATTTNAQVFLYAAAVTDFPAGTTLDLDACLIEQSDVLGDYFDGAKASTPEHRYAWAGTPDASESIEFEVTRGPSILSFGAARNVQRQLTNDGNATAYPTFTVEVDDGSGFRLTDGEHVVEWVGACSKTVPVTVDMGGTVTVNGLDRSVQLSRADWFGVPPHGSITVRLETLQGGTGSALATVRDTWI